jgi:hypothetical protein
MNIKKSENTIKTNNSEKTVVKNKEPENRKTKHQTTNSSLF